MDEALVIRACFTTKEENSGEIKGLLEDNNDPVIVPH